uniref:Secreted protein n=1 Tax=Panagrellus redivivus TaxID=6233 RepID=A0A7E4W9A5_PANRE
MVVMFLSWAKVASTPRETDMRESIIGILRQTFGKVSHSGNVLANFSDTCGKYDDMSTRKCTENNEVMDLLKTRVLMTPQAM